MTALTGPSLGDLTFIGHVGLFPLSVRSSRRNSLTGVPAHNPVQKLIEGLATGLVNASSTLKWNGAIVGTEDTPGNADPAAVSVSIPGASAASDVFLAAAGWSGPLSASFAQSVITNMLGNLAVLGRFYGDPCRTVGTGSASVDPGSNPDMYDIAKARLLSTLPAALKATGVFGKDDVPTNPLNQQISETLPHYAEAYARGLATLVAEVTYVGTDSTTDESSGTMTGSLR